MAFLETHFYSEALNLTCSAHVLLPQEKTRAQEREIPVLYLLHGYSDDHTMWMRRSAVERHVDAAAPGFAVIMPAVDHSFYTDMAHGNRYWTYVSRELPAIMGSMFPLSQRREDTFVAGLSMGGYGALKLALNQPERFLACASFSGVCDMALRKNEIDLNDAFTREMMDVFGTENDFIGSINDLNHAAGKLSESACIPRIYMSCGTSDFLYENNLRFLERLQSLGLPVEWSAVPDREHTWDFWDEQILIALKWFVKLRDELKK